jgi:hypothetical protein
MNAAPLSFQAGSSDCTRSNSLQAEVNSNGTVANSLNRHLTLKCHKINESQFIFSAFKILRLNLMLLKEHNMHFIIQYSQQYFHVPHNHIQDAQFNMVQTI